MKNGFLYKVAQTFIGEMECGNIKNFDEYCFVFPNRRSSIFFKKYLGELTSKPFFSPTLTTIGTLFGDISGLKLADKISLLIDLHSVYSKYYANTSFDEFVFWGDVILNDFDDVDKYLVDAQKLFTNIRDLNSLSSDYSFLSENQLEAIRSFWGTVIEHSNGEKEKKFISIWENLYSIYVEFKQLLKSKGEGYEGMIYREVAETLEQDTLLAKSLDKYSKVVFVGQNALNECEKILLTTLQKFNKGDYYWDFYGKEITDSKNKSSLFMKSNVENFKSHYTLHFDEFDRDLENREVISVGVPSAVGQTKYVGDLLKGLDPQKTSIVLPDETLLFPMMNSIPEGVDNVNVTMGYSLKNSPLASFISLVSELWKKAKEDSNSHETSFYHANVISILDHQYIQSIEEIAPLRLSVRNKIIESNMIFVPYTLFQVEGGGLLSFIFQSRPESITSYQLTLLELLQDRLSAIDKEFVLGYYKCINRIAGFNLQIKDDTYFRLLDQLVSTVSVPFRGEPLSGLQIMGPLETRCLDFENVIILSSNEGTFPSRSVSNSYIPYNLRLGFGLPTYEFQDSISAYHFYRSIYRAKKVVMVYDTRTEGVNKSGEASRFIKQLRYHHQVPVKDIVVSHKIFTSPKVIKSVSKTPEIIDIIEKKVRFSASSLNSYIDCPLKFYLQTIEKIEEDKGVEEAVEANSFGTMFHEVMEKLYRPYLNNLISLDNFKLISKDNDLIKTYISDSFKNVMKVSQIEGRNKVIEALLERYVKETVEIDKKSAPLILLGTELKCPISVTFPTIDKEVKFYGIIDRIDSVDGVMRVIDYKTGGYKIEIKKGDIASIFDASKGDDRPYTAFQMLLYYFLLENTSSLKFKVPQVDKTIFGVCSLKDLFKTGQFQTFCVKQEEYDEFKSRLQKMVEDIMNVEIPFQATPSEKSCKYCPFTMVCGE